MSDPLLPILWVVIALAVLLVLQRWIHAHLHGVSLLLVGRSDWAIIVYAIVLFPGVLLHEVSHWLTATLLGVRTGGMSLLPRRQPDGTLQLGYVEYYKDRRLGPVRESLIGGAPLVAGTAVILLIGFRVFGVTDLAAAVRTGDVDILTRAMADLLATPYILLWIYLIFAVSNAMLPSRSDRRAWPAFLLVMAVLAVTLFFIGRAMPVDQAGLAGNLAGLVATVFGYLGIAFSIAIAVDILFILVIALFEGILSRLQGMNVVYGRPSAGATIDDDLA
jgi:hypothetical protein